MQVKVHEAKTQLSKLLAAVERGEEVVIARGDVPVAKLVPVEARTRSGFRFGVLPEGSLGEGPDWFEPMAEEELRLWEGDGSDAP